MQGAPHWLIHYVGSSLCIVPVLKLGNPFQVCCPMLVSIKRINLVHDSTILIYAFFPYALLKSHVMLHQQYGIEGLD